MIRDRGPDFTPAFDAVLADAGIRTVLQVRHPGNPYLFHDPRRPGIHHRVGELNAANDGDGCAGPAW